MEQSNSCEDEFKWMLEITDLIGENLPNIRSPEIQKFDELCRDVQMKHEIDELISSLSEDPVPLEPM